VRNSTARTLLVSGILAALLAVGFAVLVIAVGNLREASRVALRAQQAVTAGTELERSVVALENGLRGFVATGLEADLASSDAARRAYPGQVARLKRLARDDPRLRADVRRAATLISDYIGLWAVPLLQTAREQPKVGRALLPYKTSRQRVAAIRGALARMSARARAEADATERTANARAHLAVWLGAIGIVLVVVSTGGTALLLRRKVLRPLSRDQAELARRTEDLERFNRELQDHASVTSHDLQGPLITIGMYAGLLEKHLADHPRARPLAQHIRGGAERMRGLVRDLLAYARLEREAARREPVDLEAVLDEALDALAGPLRERDAEVVAGALPTVYGDAGRLCRVLQNRLANAIKLTDGAAPRVEVTVADEPGGLARITVSDNGIGFEPGQAETIFRPFQRLHSADRFEHGHRPRRLPEDRRAARRAHLGAGRPGRGRAFTSRCPSPKPRSRCPTPASSAPAALPGDLRPGARRGRFRGGR